MRISVIVPVYNVEQYLEDCLSSLVRQSEPFFEIILVNDGSTDGSLAICERYCGRYPHMKLISQENRGLAAARNVGMRAAAGDYLIFVDSDDYIHLETNERILCHLAAQQVEVLHFNGEIRYDVPSKEKKNAYIHSAKLNGAVLTGISYFEGSFPHHWNVTVWVAAYKRSFLLEYDIRFPEGLYFEDHYFTLQVITNAKTVKCIPDIFYVRRYRENSIMTSQFSEKKCRDMATNQILLWNYLSAHGWWDKRSLARNYISSEILHTLYEMSRYSDQESIFPLKRSLAETFLTNCLDLFSAPLQHWGEALALCLTLREAERAGLREKFSDLMDWDGMYRQAETYIRDTFVGRILSVPFDQPQKKIGIYGIGQHTAELLDLYRKFAGEIRCELYFIVSECEDGSRFRDKPVIACKKIPKDTSCVLISSRMYQEEMMENLLLVGVEETKIITLYDDTDICDLTMLHWVMEQ